MTKYFYTLLACLCLCQYVTAQKSDTLKFYLKNSGEQVFHKDSADYIRMVMPAMNRSAKRKLYPVKDFYPNGKLKMTAVTTKQSLDAELHMQDTTKYYYPNGNLQQVDDYKDIGHGYRQISKVRTAYYYPDGQLCSIQTVDNKYKLSLVECHDTTGKTLAANGNGFWVNIDTKHQKITSQGPVKDGVADGSWKGEVGDTIKYECVYDNGKITSGTGYDKTGKSYNFTELSVPPAFNGKSIMQYLSANVRIPAYDRESDIDGKMIFSFEITADGDITQLKFIRSPEQHYSDAILKLLTAPGKWTGGSTCGVPQSGPIVTPLNFVISDGDE